MGFFKSLLGHEDGPKQPTLPEPWWITGGKIIDVVGESHYKPALERLIPEGASRIHLETTAVLSPEPDNPYDEKAVAVFVDGYQVGYLSRDDARRYQKRLLDLWDATNFKACGYCHAEVAGNRGRLGVRLWLLPPPQILQAPQPLGHNGPPQILKSERSVKVSTTEQYQDALKQAIRIGSGDPSVICASLRPVAYNPYEPDAGPAIVVEPACGAVGYLNKKTSEQCRRLVQQVQNAGKTANCRLKVQTGKEGLYEARVWLPAATA